MPDEVPEPEWVWFCPTCGDHDVVRGARPTFSRCMRCDSATPPGVTPPPLQIRSGLQKLLEHTHEEVLIEVIQLIESEMAKTSPDTGHGKAQRAFGNKLLERLKNL